MTKKMIITFLEFSHVSYFVFTVTFCNHETVHFISFERNPMQVAEVSRQMLIFCFLCFFICLGVSEFFFIFLSEIMFLANRLS